MNVMKYQCKMRHSEGQFQVRLDTCKVRALRSNAIFEDQHLYSVQISTPAIKMRPTGSLELL